MNQTQYIELLVAERQIPKALSYRLQETLAKGPMPTKQASDTIDWLKKQPKKVSTATAPAKAEAKVGPGVYMHDGRIVVGKLAKDKKNCYAKQLTETSKRVTEDGEVVDFEMVYVKGLIFKLTPGEQMT